MKAPNLDRVFTHYWRRCDKGISRPFYGAVEANPYSRIRALLSGRLRCPGSASGLPNGATDSPYSAPPFIPVCSHPYGMIAPVLSFLRWRGCRATRACRCTNL